MSVPLVVNGVTFNYPQEFDLHWGPVLTAWSTAVTNALKPLAGGILTLPAYPNSGVLFANATNTGFLSLTINASNQLTFNGTPIGTAATLTDNHIFVGNALNQPADVAMSGDATIIASGALTIANGAITDVKVNASAAIALSKLAPLTASAMVVTNGSGVLASLATPSLTTLSYLDATSSIQTQLNSLTNYLPLSGGTLSGNLNLASNQINGLGPATLLGQALSFGNALNGTTLTLTGQLLAEDGSLSAPAYSFTNAPASGMRHVTYAPVSVAAADWNTANAQVTAPQFGIRSGVIGKLTTTGTLPSGLSLSTHYYIIWWNADTFSLASSYINYLDLIPDPFTTTGTGIHTFTALPVGDVGFIADANEPLRVSLEDGAMTGTVWIGNTNNNLGTQYSELIHAEGNYHAGGGVPAAADIALNNTGGHDARFIALSYTPTTIIPAVAGYWEAHGINNGSNYMAGFPMASTCELRSQGGSLYFTQDNNGQFFFMAAILGGGSIGLTIGGTGIVPHRADSDPTPFEEGQMYYNTTSHQMRYWNGSSWIGW